MLGDGHARRGGQGPLDAAAGIEHEVPEVDPLAIRLVRGEVVDPRAAAVLLQEELVVHPGVQGHQLEAPVGARDRRDPVGPRDALGLLRAGPGHVDPLHRGALRVDHPAGGEPAGAEHEVHPGVGRQLGERELGPLAAVPLGARPQVRQVAAPDAAHPDELVLPLEVGGAGPLEGPAEAHLGAGDRAPGGIGDDAVDTHPGVQVQVHTGAHARPQLHPLVRGDGGVLGGDLQGDEAGGEVLEEEVPGEAGARAAQLKPTVVPAEDQGALHRRAVRGAGQRALEDRCLCELQHQVLAREDVGPARHGVPVRAGLEVQGDRGRDGQLEAPGRVGRTLRDFLARLPLRHVGDAELGVDPARDGHSRAGERCAGGLAEDDPRQEPVVRGRGGRRLGRPGVVVAARRDPSLVDHETLQLRRADVGPIGRGCRAGQQRVVGGFGLLEREPTDRGEKRCGEGEEGLAGEHEGSLTRARPELRHFAVGGLLGVFHPSLTVTPISAAEAQGPPLFSERTRTRT